jgi:hypothetical protein
MNNALTALPKYDDDKDYDNDNNYCDDAASHTSRIGDIFICQRLLRY